MNRAALFLASDMSSFVTGTAMLVDGGVSISGRRWVTGGPPAYACGIPHILDSGGCDNT